MMNQQLPSRRRKVRMSPQDALKVSKKLNQKSRQVISQLGSEGEEKLARHLQVEGIKYEREFKFNPKRRFKADFYIEPYKLLIEVEGGTKSKSRHTTHEGYSKDLIKYNSAQILGYARLAFTTEQVSSGLAIQTIREFIKARDQEKNITVSPSLEPNAVIKQIINGDISSEG